MESFKAGNVIYDLNIYPRWRGFVIRAIAESNTIL
jgi:hypothetical protein